MKMDIVNLPKSPELLQKMVLILQNELSVSKSELISYKEKYVRLIEELRLARQQRFAPSSEKNRGQSDLFDEAGVELTEELQAQIEEQVETESKNKRNYSACRWERPLLPQL